MKNIFDESENLSLEERITILSDMINGLCDRFDRFERILLKIEDSISVDNLRLKEQECISTSSDDGVDRMQKQSWGMLQVENDTKNVSSEVSFAEENNASEPFSSQIRYCGQPAGCGFEIDDITEEKGIRSLYVIELIDGNTALYYPLEEKIVRFKNSLTSLFMPVCDIDTDLLDCESFEVEKENYGILTLEDGSYWKVVKKCLVTCIK